jgi:hypothetical protein
MELIREEVIAGLKSAVAMVTFEKADGTGTNNALYACQGYAAQDEEVFHKEDSVKLMKRLWHAYDSSDKSVVAFIPS